MPEEIKRAFDHRGTIKKLLHVMVEDGILVYQVDMVLEGLKQAVFTSTAVQELWVDDEYGNYNELPVK